MSRLRELVDPVIGRWDLPSGRVELVRRIAEKLVAKPGNDVASKEKVTDALLQLLADDKLELPDDAISKDDFDPSFLDIAKNAITTALADAGLGGLGPLTVGAIKFINNSLDRCGVAPDSVEKPVGPPVQQKNGRPVIVFFLEEDSNGLPLLPAIAGDPRFARTRLILAFEHWQGKLKLDVTQTELPDQANLIVTGERFGPRVPDSRLALTDVGPPHGKKCRMVFDLAEVNLTKDEFEATAAHEFGHALGVRHRHAAKKGQLMSPSLSSIKEPLDADIAAAVRHAKWDKA